MAAAFPDGGGGKSLPLWKTHRPKANKTPEWLLHVTELVARWFEAGLRFPRIPERGYEVWVASLIALIYPWPPRFHECRLSNEMR